MWVSSFSRRFISVTALISFLLIQLVPCLSQNSTSSMTITYHPLLDSRLCNNENSPVGYNATMCLVHRNVHDHSKVPCDQRNIAADGCRIIAVEMDSFNYEIFMAKNKNIDTDISIRRIEVKLNAIEIDIDTVGNEIDKFLTPRPWWHVVKEPYKWNKHTHRIIVIDRVQHQFEPSLRVLAALQYPASKRICANTPLVVNRQDFHHPGWYSVLIVEQMVHNEFPFALTSMYVTRQNSVEESTSFIAATDCKDRINKWECAFLPTTSCPIPDVITKCNQTNCVTHAAENTRWSSAIFDGAKRDGKLYVSNVGDIKKATARAAKPPADNGLLQSEVVKAHKTPQPHVLYLEPHNPAKASWEGNMYVNGDMFTYSFLLRYNAFYRSTIAQTIHEFRIAHGFKPSDRCVAAQIRRGDRTPGGNITDYCLNSQHVNPDMGCQDVPYASVDLKHVIDSAIHVSGEGIRNLVVTTDDEAWLEEQRAVVKESYPDWRILSLSVPKKDDGQDGDYAYMRYGAGTASGVLYHGSIELSRQCEGFVGHFGCGGTMLVYKSLCAQHRQYEYVCPPSFDVRTIKELRMPKMKG